MTSGTLLRPADPSAPARHRQDTSREPRRLLRPGWPLAALLMFFPVWWAMGLMELIFPVLAVPMARELMRRRPIKLPPRFGLWALFLIWVAVGIVMLELDPVGTLPGTAVGRLIGYSVKLIEFASMTVILLYLGNLTERELPRLRVVRMLGIFFLVAVGGGLLGTVLPSFEFSSPLELVLPQGIRSNLYVQSLVHPAAAQVQDVLGYDAPRPKAPFDYTNSWGNNTVVLGIWFAVGWWAYGGKRRRVGVAVLACLAAVPIIYSLNRGVWIGIVIAVGYAAVRLALRGKPIVLFGATGLVVLAVGIVLVSPLNQVINDRLENPRSNDIRASLNEQAVRVAGTSPVLGYGSTRTAVGSPQSIAVGRTSSCQRCGNAAIGSTGQLWQLLISNGYIGTGLYLGYFLAVLWRYRRDSTAIGIAGSLVIVLTLFFALFYNVLASPLALVMISIGLLWRNEQARNEEAARTAELRSEEARAEPPRAEPARAGLRRADPAHAGGGRSRGAFPVGSA